MIGHRLGGLLGHALGHLIGQRNEQGGGPAPLVLDIAAGSPVASNSTTAVNPGKPSSTDGDLLLLVVSATSVVTAPAGWTLVATSTNPNYAMHTDVYSAPGGTAGQTVSQSASGAMSACYLRVRPLHGGTLSVDAIATDSVQNSANNPEPMVSVTPTANGVAFYFGSSAGQGASTTVKFTPSSGWHTPYPDALFRWRLAVAWQNATAGNPTSGSVASTGYAPPTSTSSWTKVALVIKES